MRMSPPKAGTKPILARSPRKDGPQSVVVESAGALDKDRIVLFEGLVKFGFRCRVEAQRTPCPC